MGINLEISQKNNTSMRRKTKKKKILKFGSMGISVALAILLLVAFTPGGVTINLGGFLPGQISLGNSNFSYVKQGDFLSFQSNVALAVNNPPESEFTEQSYAIGNEVIEKRTRSSKTHYLGGGSYSWDGIIGTIHYKDNPQDEAEQWKDIDTAIVTGKVNKAPYDLDIYLTGMPGFHYKSKESGEFDIRLRCARNTKGRTLRPDMKVKPKVEGNRVIWENIYPNTDVILEVQNTRVSLKRLIKSDKAPLEFDIDIQEVQ